MNKSVYIESSVISYLTARPSRDLVIAGHQAVTAEWWDDRRLRYDVYVSPLVVEEISAGDALAAEERLRVIADIPSVAIAAEAESLASALLAANAVPANSARDALHIAIAATQGIDYPGTFFSPGRGGEMSETTDAGVDSGRAPNSPRRPHGGGSDPANGVFGLSGQSCPTPPGGAPGRA